MSAPRITPMAELDLDVLHALNNRFAAQLSEMTAEAFAGHVAKAFYAKGCDAPAAFLLAYVPGSEISGPNFNWFKRHYADFVYIDRVAVAPEGRGQGIARALYEDLFAAARDAGHALVGCEVNLDPPNPVSDAFHAAIGFGEVGRAYVPSSGRTVRYLVRGLVRDQQP